jgi:hypothetical protein
VGVDFFIKILVPLILALVAALAIAGVAYAAGQPEKAPSPAAQLAAEDGNTAQARHRGLGQITALGDGQFTVQLKSGEEKVIRVDGNTRYYKADGSAGSFADLQVGRWVAGRVIDSEDGLLAMAVAVRPNLIRHAGEINTVDPAASTFGLKARQGENLTFQADENTQYFGQVESLSE